MNTLDNTSSYGYQVAGASPTATLYNASPAPADTDPSPAGDPAPSPSSSPAAPELFPQQRPEQASAAASGQSAGAILSRHFDETLKNTGIKAEIQIEKGVGMIVRLVQSDTGKVVVQLPPQGVIELVAEIQQQQDQRMKIAAPESVAATADGGNAGGEPPSASGALIDQMA